MCGGMCMTLRIFITQQYKLEITSEIKPKIHLKKTDNSNPLEELLDISCDFILPDDPDRGVISYFIESHWQPYVFWIVQGKSTLS